MRNFVIGALVGALLSVGGYYLYHTQRAQAWENKVARANERAAHYVLQYRKVSDSWHDLAVQQTEQDSLLAEVRSRNAKLAERLAEERSRVQALVEARARLEAALDSSATTVRRDTTVRDPTLVVDVDERVTLQGGGYVQVRGPITVKIEEPSVSTRLDVEGEFPISIVVSRTPEGDVHVDAFTGDPRLSITRLDTEVHVEPPAGVSAGFDLGRQVLGLSPWLNRAGGFLVGLAVCR